MMTYKLLAEPIVRGLPVLGVPGVGREGTEGAIRLEGPGDTEASLAELLGAPNHSSFTGGGRGVDTVLVLTSPMIFRASRIAAYKRNKSSLRWVSPADSSIKVV